MVIKWLLRAASGVILLVLALTASIPLGMYAMPGLDLWLALGLAVAAGIVLAIALRVLMLAVLGSLFLAALLTLAIFLAAQLTFFEVEKQKWLDDSEFPSQLSRTDADKTYMKSLGLDAAPNPVLNWLSHTEAQAQRGLSSQQLSANQVGIPRETYAPEDVWFGWLSQLMMFVISLFCAGLLARRKSRS